MAPERRWVTRGEALLCLILTGLTLLVAHCVMGAWLLTSQSI